MFGKKKMYKKGLADAMSAYQDFGTKQEEALAAIREEVRKGKKQLEDALFWFGRGNGWYLPIPRRKGKSRSLPSE